MGFKNVIYLFVLLSCTLLNQLGGGAAASRKKQGLNCTRVCGIGSGCLLQAVWLRGSQKASLTSQGGTDSN